MNCRFFLIFFPLLFSFIFYPVIVHSADPLLMFWAVVFLQNPLINIISYNFSIIWKSKFWVKDINLTFFLAERQSNIKDLERMFHNSAHEFFFEQISPQRYCQITLKKLQYQLVSVFRGISVKAPSTFSNSC